MNTLKYTFFIVLTVFSIGFVSSSAFAQESDATLETEETTVEDVGITPDKDSLHETKDYVDRKLLHAKKKHLDQLAKMKGVQKLTKSKRMKRLKKLKKMRATELRRNIRVLKPQDAKVLKAIKLTNPY